jgi:hypothetical protein
MVTKIDLKKELKYLYNPSAKAIEEVEVPEFNFAMVKGFVPAGVKVAEAPEFVEALTALYGISYSLKFAVKQSKVEPVDYHVMALEFQRHDPAARGDHRRNIRRCAGAVKEKETLAGIG